MCLPLVCLELYIDNGGMTYRVLIERAFFERAFFAGRVLGKPAWVSLIGARGEEPRKLRRSKNKAIRGRKERMKHWKSSWKSTVLLALLLALAAAGPRYAAAQASTCFPQTGFCIGG